MPTISVRAEATLLSNYDFLANIQMLPNFVYILLSFSPRRVTHPDPSYSVARQRMHGHKYKETPGVLACAGAAAVVVNLRALEQPHRPPWDINFPVHCGGQVSES